MANGVDPFSRPQCRERIETRVIAVTSRRNPAFSRPQCRERIETGSQGLLQDLAPPFSRPQCRERIETCRTVTLEWPQEGLSPGLSAGSGLKRPVGPVRLGDLLLSPGLSAGSG